MPDACAVLTVCTLRVAPKERFSDSRRWHAGASTLRGDTARRLDSVAVLSRGFRSSIRSALVDLRD